MKKKLVLCSLLLITILLGLSSLLNFFNYSEVLFDPQEFTIFEVNRLGKKTIVWKLNSYIQLGSPENTTAKEVKIFMLNTEKYLLIENEYNYAFNIKNDTSIKISDHCAFQRAKLSIIDIRSSMVTGLDIDFALNYDEIQVYRNDKESIYLSSTSCRSDDSIPDNSLVLLTYNYENKTLDEPKILAENVLIYVPMFNPSNELAIYTKHYPQPGESDGKEYIISLKDDEVIIEESDLTYQPVPSPTPFNYKSVRGSLYLVPLKI